MATSALPGLVVARLAVAAIEGDEKWSKEQLRIFRLITERLNELVAEDMEVD